MKIIERNGHYYAHGPVNGKRIRLSLSTTDKAEAKRNLVKLMGELANNNGKPVDHKTTMADVADKYFAHFKDLVANGKRKPGSLEFYRVAWNSLQRYSPGIAERRPAEVNSVTFVDSITVKGCGDKPASPGWYNQCMTCLHALLLHAQGLGCINLAVKIEHRENQMRKYKLDDAAELALMPHIGLKDDDLRDIIRLVRQTGLRCARECAALRVEYVDLDAGVLRVPRDSTKTDAGCREVFLTDSARSVLARRIGKRTQGWVFPRKDGSTHIGTKYLATRFRKACDKAGLPQGLKLYSGRHDFGTYLYEQTKDPLEVMGVMGQTNFAAFQRYIIRNTASTKLAEIMNARPMPLAAAVTISDTKQ
jgi:integrase